MENTDTWRFIHSERAEMAKTLSALSDEQWAAASWCAGWSVTQAAGHILAAAEQTPIGFYKELLGAGMKFNVFTDRGAKSLGALPHAELVSRLEARTTTTNHPPAPVVAMLGEIVVHGEDIRRPLGLTHRSPEEALIAVADNFKRSNLLIGAKRRIAGLTLKATDADWSNGSGPEVTGPLQSMVLVMAGRKAALADLSGEGVPTLQSRP